MARRILTGLVVSSKGHKSIVVAVATRKTHPIYKKQYSVTTKVMAHDEKDEAHDGDRVSIEETRPISARKHFVLKEIVERAGVTHQEDPVEIVQDKGTKR